MTFDRRSFIAWISSLCVVLPWSSKLIPAEQVSERQFISLRPAASCKVITSINRDGLTEIKTIGACEVGPYRCDPILPTGFIRVRQTWEHNLFAKTVNFEIIDREIKKS